LTRRIFAVSTSVVLLCCSVLTTQCSRDAREYLGSGTLEGTEVTVSALVNGTLLALSVGEGDSVSAGSPLARIDVEKMVLQREQIQAQRAEAEASIDAARQRLAQADAADEEAARRFGRIAALFEEGAVARQEYDEAETAHTVAHAEREAAEAALEAVRTQRERLASQSALIDKQIAEGDAYAPIDGIVVAKFAEQGEVVGFGSPLVTLADLSRLWVRVYVGERDLGAVGLGEDVSIRVDAYTGEVFSGRVVWISPRAEFTPKNVETRDVRAELVFAVKVEIPNPNRRLMIGMPAEVYLPTPVE
jgi:HlyD family secretion protein